VATLKFYALPFALFNPFVQLAAPKRRGSEYAGRINLRRLLVPFGSLSFLLERITVMPAARTHHSEAIFAVSSRKQPQWSRGHIGLKIVFQCLQMESHRLVSALIVTSASWLGSYRQVNGCTSFGKKLADVELRHTHSF